MESTHHILKTVNGAPNPRPPFFFDIHDQGEGLTDVGTHLVDLVQWTLFPNQALDYRQDIHVQGGKRWPTPISLSSSSRSPARRLSPRNLPLTFTATNSITTATIRWITRFGRQVRLKVLWNWESPAGVDFHHAIYRGTRASVEVRQTVKENYRPELFVAPNGAEHRAAVAAAVSARIERLQGAYPGFRSNLPATSCTSLFPTVTVWATKRTLPRWWRSS